MSENNPVIKRKLSSPLVLSMKCQKSEMVGFSGPQAAVASSSSRGQQNILAEGRQGSRAVRAAERQGSRAVWTAEATG